MIHFFCTERIVNLLKASLPYKSGGLPRKRHSTMPSIPGAFGRIRRSHRDPVQSFSSYNMQGQFMDTATLALTIAIVAFLYSIAQSVRHFIFTKRYARDLEELRKQ